MPTERTRVEKQSLPPSAQAAAVDNDNGDAPGEARRRPPPSSTRAKLLVRAERGVRKKKIRGGKNGGMGDSSSLPRRENSDDGADGASFGARSREAAAVRSDSSTGGVARRSRKRKRTGGRRGLMDDNDDPASPPPKMVPAPLPSKQKNQFARWLEREDKILIASKREHGNKWATIQQLLPGRSGNAIQKRWKSKCIQDKIAAMSLRGELPINIGAGGDGGDNGDIAVCAWPSTGEASVAEVACSVEKGFDQRSKQRSRASAPALAGERLATVIPPAPETAGGVDSGGETAAAVERGQGNGKVPFLPPTSEGVIDDGNGIAVREWPLASEGVAAGDEWPAPSADEGNVNGPSTAGEDGGERGAFSGSSRPPSKEPASPSQVGGDVHDRYSLAVRSLVTLEKRLLEADRVLRHAQIERDAAFEATEAGRAERDDAAEAVVRDEIEKGEGQWWELYREMAVHKEQRGECYFGVSNRGKRRKRKGEEETKTMKAATVARQGADDVLIRDEDVRVGGGGEGDSAPLAELSKAEGGVTSSKADGPDRSGADVGAEDTSPDGGASANGDEEEEKTSSYLRLQRFASQCRSSHRRDRMDWIQTAALERLDFEWDESEAKWRTWYHALKDFKARHGHVDISSQCGGRDRGGLARWLVEQRRLWRKRDKGEGEDVGDRIGEGEEVEDGNTADNGKSDKDDIGRTKVGVCLSDERVRLLQDLGVPRDLERRTISSDAQWNTYFEDLKQFRSENTGADANFGIPADRTGLRKWVERQQFLLRHKVEGRNWINIDSLSEERVRLLEEIGVTAESIKEGEEREWKAKYDELKAWRSDEGGGTLVQLPMEHALCPWLGRQLRGWRVMLASGSTEHKNKSTIMNGDRARLLEGLGLTPDVRVGAPEKKWQERYSALKAYRAENGHVDVPKGHPLQPWVARQRELWRKKEAGGGDCGSSSLSDDRANLLSELGLTAPALTSPATGTDSTGGTGSKSDIREERWLVNYEKLLAFKEQFGDCCVPRIYDEDPELGLWVYYQRKKIRRHEKNPTDSTSPTLERFTALLDLGLDANVATVGAYQRQKSDEKWEGFYRALVAYQTEHGDLNVRRAEATKLLHRWIDAQRRNYLRRQKGDKNSPLSDEQIAKLTAIGFSFARPRMEFDDHFNLLVEFKKLHGHTRVPVQYKGHGKLGEWTRKVRETYLNGEMPDPPRKNRPDDAMRVAKLRGINFDFDKRKRGVLGRGDADDSKFTMPIRQMNILQNGSAW